MARVSTGSSRPISPGAVGRVGPVTFLRETIAELRKSVWPSREETVRLTFVVIVVSIVMAFYLGGMDRVFAETFTRYVLRL